MKKKILIIEDELEAFKYIKKLCQNFGYFVLPDSFDEMAKAFSTNGDITTYATQQVKIHYQDLRLIICDIYLQDDFNGGNKVVKSIRAIKDLDPIYLSSLPIIAITNYPARQSQILWDGADISIVKNQIEPMVLGAFIETLIRKFERIIASMHLTITNNKVFIAHGHADVKLVDDLIRFLSYLGLQPIILHELPENETTIIDKFERFSDVGYAIILYTSSDSGKYENKPMKPSARQNVAFEHGYMTAKLGRENVCILVEQGVELPGDISGLVYLPLDKSGIWKYQLAKNMKERGFDIDMNKVFNSAVITN